jgi:hypothetical protein
LGRYYQGQGKRIAATEAFEKALATDPRHAESLSALGALYAEQGNAIKSAEMFRRLAEISPVPAYLYNNIGYALYLQGRYSEAIEALRTAVTIDPGYTRAWVNLEQVARADGNEELLASVARRTLPEYALATAIAAPPTANVNTTSPTNGVAIAATRTIVATEPTKPLGQTWPSNAGALLANANTPTSIRLTEVQPEPYVAAALPSATHATATPTALKDVGVPPQTRQIPIYQRPKISAHNSDARDLALQAIATTVSPLVSSQFSSSVDNRDNASRGKAAAFASIVGASGVQYHDARDRLLTSMTHPVRLLPVGANAPTKSTQSQNGTRFEILNGNGVKGFASRLGTQLRREGVRVVSIADHSSFTVRRTAIEYQRGHAEAAKALGKRLRISVAIQETTLARAGSDVRLVLGHDACSFGGTCVASLRNTHQSRVGSTRVM